MQVSDRTMPLQWLPVTAGYTRFCKATGYAGGYLLSKKKAEAMCEMHKKYKHNSKYERIITIFLGAIGNGFLSAVLIQLLC